MARIQFGTVQYRIVRLWDLTKSPAWADEIPQVERALNSLARNGWAVSCSPANGILPLFRPADRRERNATSKRSEHSKRSKRPKQRK